MLYNFNAPFSVRGVMPTHIHFLIRGNRTANVGIDPAKPFLVVRLIGVLVWRGITFVLSYLYTERFALN